MHDLDASFLAAALDAWERHPNPLDDAPYEAFRAAHPKAARYLWLLSRSLGPPNPVEAEPIRDLLAWELVTADARVSPLGLRLLATAKRRLAADPFGSMRAGRERKPW